MFSHLPTKEEPGLNVSCDSLSNKSQMSHAINIRTDGLVERTYWPVIYWQEYERDNTGVKVLNIGFVFK